MRIWPVIQRELRASARQPFTYWLRVIGGSALLVSVRYTAYALRTLWMQPAVFFGGGARFTSWPSISLTSPTLSAAAFGAFNFSIFLVLALLTPLLTADSISRERREGTLGLLFLTPLRPSEIVLGKGCVHLLRGLTLYLTMLPWLMAPVVLGGVGFGDFTLAVLLDSGVLVLGLSAGLLASTCCRDSLKSMVLAVTLSIGLTTVFLHGHVALFMHQVVPAITTTAQPYAQHITNPGGSVFSRACACIEFTTSCAISRWRTGRVETVWSSIWPNLPPGRHWLWHQVAAELLLACGLVGTLTLRFAARRLRRTWVERPPSEALQKAERVLFRTRFLSGFLRARLNRALARNPIGWLHQHSPRARLVKQGWLLFIILGESLAALDFTGGGGLHDFVESHLLLGACVMVGLAFAAASSFRVERENGALELLLVCPFSTSRLIWGRLRGVWGQFLPAVGVWALIDLLAISWTSDYGRTAWETRLLVWFLTLPVVGLWASVHRWHPLAAGLLTSALGLGLAGALTWGTTALLSWQFSQTGLPTFDPQWQSNYWIVLQIALAGFAFHRLHRILDGRLFVVKRSRKKARLQASMPPSRVSGQLSR